MSKVDIACHIALQAGAIMISDPLIPLTLNAEAYAVVPLRPVRMLHVGIVTPALNPDSRLTTLFKLCLREEVKSIKERLTDRFGNLKAPRNREVSRRRAKPRDRVLSSESSTRVSPLPVRVPPPSAAASGRWGAPVAG